MQQEFKALQDNNTWDLVPLPKGKHPSAVSGSTKLSINLMEV